MGLNIRGGSRVIQYYASLNYIRDEGMLKTEKLNHQMLTNHSAICRAKTKMKFAEIIKEIYIIDKIFSPFVTGILKPIIYLPQNKTL